MTLLLLVVPVFLALSGHWPASPPDTTVSNETTWLRQPLCKDERADYATELDNEAREGVTPANNLAVAVMRASGPPWPDREAVPERDALFRAPEMEPLPLKGDYVDLDEIARRHLGGAATSDAVFDLQSDLGQQWLCTDKRRHR